MIERKKSDDLVSPTKKEKWRMKRNLDNFTFIYLIEKKHIENYQQKMMKHGLNETEIRDRFLIYHTNQLIESIKKLSN